MIQLVAFNSYVKCDPKRDIPREQARAAAMEDLRKEYGIVVPAGGGRGAGGGGAGGGGGGRGALQAAIQALPEAKRNEYLAKQEDITARRYPSDPPATVKDFVDHIDYVVKRIGIDHVGISSDFDGGGGVDGFRNATEAPNVTIELVRRGYTEQQIAKIWGGNLLRVMEAVEKTAGK